MSNEPLLELANLEKVFSQGSETLSIFRDLSLIVEAGEIVALVGQSGAGKSTLLHIAGLLDKPSFGTVLIEGRDVTGFSDYKRTILRRHFIGFIYQFHYLLPEFSAMENVILPQMIAGKSRKEAKERAAYLLETLNLGHRLKHRPARLSGGEQQRVAIARALANEPKLILADEPTGNLDPDTSAEVFEMLLSLVKNEGIGALIATHNLDLADQMDRILELRNGKVSAY